MSHKLKCGLPFGRIDHDIRMTDNQSAVNFINNIFFFFLQEIIDFKILKSKRVENG